jgi:hypothetical protein
MPPTDKPVSRREFARRAAIGAASATLLPLTEFVPSAEATASPGSDAKLSPQSQAEAESRFQAILQQYPERFSDGQKADLKRLTLALQPSLDHLRAYAISNSDLPALYLKPLVDRDKMPSTRPAAAAPGAAKSAPPEKPKTSSPGKP